MFSCQLKILSCLTEQTPDLKGAIHAKALSRQAHLFLGNPTLPLSFPYAVLKLQVLRIAHLIVEPVETALGCTSCLWFDTWSLGNGACHGGGVVKAQAHLLSHERPQFSMYHHSPCPNSSLINTALSVGGRKDYAPLRLLAGVPV